MSAKKEKRFWHPNPDNAGSPMREFDRSILFSCSDSVYRRGAPTGTRTRTSFLTADLKSDVATSYTIGAYWAV